MQNLPELNTKKIYDVVGIGIGPFNLGLAALTEPVHELSALFLDRSADFDWHPGLMLDSATLQVPFMADLVTMADPSSKYSFLNFLKETDRLYKFYIRENFFILRKEFNIYCKWVVGKLSNCLFNRNVESVEYIAEEKLYCIRVSNNIIKEQEVYYALRIVLGTGTIPCFPTLSEPIPTRHVIHAADYLAHRHEIIKGESVALIGSGQSAAEIFQDLLPETEKGLQISWFSRPDRFFPMEYSKFTLELTSPEYIDYFYNMNAAKRREILTKQPPLYKGISFDLINDIFDRLYEMSVGNRILNVEMRPCSQLDRISQDISGMNTLYFTEVQQQQPFSRQAAFVVLATGYKYKMPEFADGIEKRISRTEDGLFNVKRNYSVGKEDEDIFVQNAELHTHGFVAPDLGMGAYRNASIINTITKREVYKVEHKIAFQHFGV